MVLVVHILAQDVHTRVLGVRIRRAQDVHKMEWVDDMVQVCGILVLDEVAHMDLKWDDKIEASLINLV